MRHPEALRSHLVLGLVAAALSGCAGGSPGSGETSCAAVVDYAGHRYIGHGELKRDPPTTGTVDIGSVAECDDGNGAEPQRQTQVAELADVPMTSALLVDGTLYIRDDRPFPAAARRWFTSPACDTAGELELRGDWLAAQGPRRLRFDGDLRPPYRVEMHVTDGPSPYQGATLTVQATRRTTPGLGPQDVKTSLLKGGQLTAQVGCRGDRFVASALHSTPG